MNCPNCGFENVTNHSCQKCGFDIVLFNRALQNSHSLYNNGLYCAEMNDLSGAIVSLEKSVSFHKNNIDARNLLGLLYFETGEIGNALKQWILSSSIQKDKNIATDYIDMVQSRGRELEKLNDAVKMYNNALTYVKQKSTDMAIIQLKKSIELNPKLLIAHNLLAYCYMAENNHEKAISNVNCVLAMDVNNPIAAFYYAKLKPGTAKPSQAIEPKSPIHPPPIRRRVAEPSKGAFPLTEVLAFVIGVICMLAAMYILIIPGALGTRDKQISDLSNKYAQLEAQAAQDRQTSKDTLDALQLENETLRQDNAELLEKQQIQEKLNKMYEAANLFNDNSPEEAATILSTIVFEDLPAEAKEEYNSLKEKVYKAAAQSFYNKGRTAYNTQQYAEAQTLLDKALTFASSENFIGDALYYLGRMAENNDDLEKAKSFYERILNEFSNSNQYWNARNRLRIIDA